MVTALEASALNPRDPDSANAPDGARAALRARIAEEVERQGGHPLARRTLALLVESALAPEESANGERFRDRRAQPRGGDPVTSPEGTVAPEATPDLPLTLTAYVSLLRERHPTLFAPPAPEPAPVEAAPPPAGESPAPGAPARLIAAQTVLARTLLNRAAARGRAVSVRTAARWQDLRRRYEARRAETPTQTPAGTASILEAPRGPGAFVRGAAGGLRGRIADAGARLQGAGREGGILRDRRVLVVGAGLLGLLAVVVLIPPVAEGTRPAPATAPQAEAIPTPPTRAETPPADEAAKAGGTALTGSAEVIDTATLRVAGKLVRLFGVEWVRGGQADELTRYLAGRTVTCQPVAGSEARQCEVDGRDLSEVVLFNGGGRASAEATPDLVAAEDRARTERLGVWAR